jgi:hypothetical protein
MDKKLQGKTLNQRKSSARLKNPFKLGIFRGHSVDTNSSQEVPLAFNVPLEDSFSVKIWKKRDATENTPNTNYSKLCTHGELEGH